MNSLNKIPKNYNPLFNKNPGDMYLREVYQYQTYREKMKKYNRITGKFNIFMNKTKSNSNKLIINDFSKENNKTLENDKSPKNISKILKKSYFLPKSDMLFNATIYATINQENQKRRGFLRKNNTLNKEIWLQTDSNIKKNNQNDIFKFIFDKDNNNDSVNKKLNPLNTRRNSELKYKIKYEVNDPYNPYSTIWPNKFLNVNYNMELHYTDLEQGVPLLKAKKLKKKNLPPIYINNITRCDDKFICNTFSSKCKKFLNLHLNRNDSNNANKENKTNG